MSGSVPGVRTDKARGTATPYPGILSHETATSYGMGRFSLAQSFSMSDSGGGTRPCVRPEVHEGLVDVDLPVVAALLDEGRELLLGQCLAYIA